MSRRAARFTEANTCSFCGLSDPERGRIIRGGAANLCEHCLGVIVEVVNSWNEGGQQLALEPRPQGILPDKMLPPVTWEQPGFVYFLHATLSNRVKIGFSLKPNKRLAEILTSCPEAVVYLGCVPAAYKDESALHQKFASIRVHREWFEAVPELLAYIKEVVK